MLWDQKECLDDIIHTLKNFKYIIKYPQLGSWFIGIRIYCHVVLPSSIIRRGEKGTDNPWGALTLEWTIPSPPAYHAFNDTPIVTRAL